MIILRLNSFSELEIADLILRLEAIKPESPTCKAGRCTTCPIKHVCYSIDSALEYAKRTLKEEYGHEIH